MPAAARLISAVVSARMRLLAALLGLAVLAVTGGLLLCGVLLSMSLSVLVLGVPLTLMSLSLVRGFADAHRRWAGDIIGEPIPRPYLETPPGTPWQQRLVTVVRDPATWRDLLWLLVNATLGFTLTLLPGLLFLGGIFYLLHPYIYSLTSPSVFATNYGVFRVHNQATAFLPMIFGVVLLALWVLLQRRILRLNALTTKSLLGVSEHAALKRRVTQLAQNRTDTVDQSASELRRIERDLHDGPQARLAAMAMTIGLATELLERDPTAAHRLLNETSESMSVTLAELRDLVRGIHPPVLADRGLGDAVRALLVASPIPVDIVIDLPARLPAPVESAAYFAVAENIANAIKHSGATQLALRMQHRDGQLDIRIRDDGRGGADPSAGSGIRGIQRRLCAFDGTLSIDSPIGGPTEIRMNLPCESS